MQQVLWLCLPGRKTLTSLQPGAMPARPRLTLHTGVQTTASLAATMIYANASSYSPINLQMAAHRTLVIKAADSVLLGCSIILRGAEGCSMQDDVLSTGGFKSTASIAAGRHSRFNGVPVQTEALGGVTIIPPIP